MPPAYTKGTPADSRQFEIIGLGRLRYADQRPLILGGLFIPVVGIDHQAAQFHDGPLKGVGEGDTLACGDLFGQGEQLCLIPFHVAPPS